MLTVYTAKTNPLNGKVLGVDANSYAGDVRVVEVQPPMLRVAVTWDYDIRPGMAVSGAWIEDSSSKWENKILVEQVWGILRRPN